MKKKSGKGEKKKTWRKPQLNKGKERKHIKKEHITKMDDETMTIIEEMRREREGEQDWGWLSF